MIVDFVCKRAQYTDNACAAVWHFLNHSTDMLEKIKTREESYNNRGAISRSPILSSLTLYYYRCDMVPLVALASRSCTPPWWCILCLLPDIHLQ